MSDARPKPPETPAEIEEKIDEALESTFPASDPPSTGGTTGPGDKREAAWTMRATVPAPILLAIALIVACACAAQAQPADPSGARPGNEIGTGMSLPRSDRASNLNAATTHSELAPNLPSPGAGDDIQTLLIAARAALVGGRTGEAQEALERAESRALDRSVPYGTRRLASEDRLTMLISASRTALAAGDTRGAAGIAGEALPYAAMADIPH